MLSESSAPDAVRSVGEAVGEGRSGVLVIDKASGPSSFLVVKRVHGILRRAWGRQGAGARKIGHGGTLDPLASGVLPVCVGEATKVAGFLLDAEKEYEGTARLGIETDTLDAAGAVVSTTPVPAAIDAAAIEAVLSRFRGALQQVPPMYSALKRDGRPLYDYARAGEAVEREARPIVIERLTLTAWEPPDTFRFEVRCSKGTYVRVLAADIGKALGVGAHLAALRRTVSGPFRLDQSITLAELERRVLAREPLPFISASEALAHLSALTVTAEVAQAIVHGKPVTASALGAPEGQRGRVRILRPQGSLLAVMEILEENVRSLRVFAAE